MTNPEDAVSWCYEISIIGFLTVNIVWDVISKHTPKFTLERLREKHNVIFSATTFSSGVLIIVGLANHDVMKVLADQRIQFALAGFGGILSAIPDLSPMKTRDRPEHN